MILLVDDDYRVCDFLTEVLHDEGYRLECAGNGHDALHLLHQMTILPQLILLDLLMPIMDGWSFVAAIRGEPRLDAIPVIVFSVILDPGARIDRSVVQGYLPKPFDLDALLTLVAQYCGPRAPSL